MKLTTVVRVVLDPAGETPIPDVKVSLYDRDRLTTDDHIATRRTDADGAATFEYYSEDFVDLDERLGGLRPELYVVLRDRHDRVVLTTRSEAVKNATRAEIVVPVSRELAERYELLATAP
jgi:hypothetical protein